MVSCLRTENGLSPCVFTQGYIVPSLMEIELVQFWRRFLMSLMYFRYIISLLNRSCPFIWTNFDSLYSMMPSNCVKSTSWNWSVVLEKKNLQYSRCIFATPRVSILGRGCMWFFINRINLYPLHLRMLCDKFCWNWPCASKGEDKMWKVDKDFDDEHWYLPRPIRTSSRLGRVT